MLQDNTAITTDAATEAEAASVPGYEHWCPKCYLAGIEQQISGFTVEHNRPGFAARIVPPLHPGTALSLRQAAARVIAQRAGYPSDAASHPRHAGAR